MLTENMDKEWENMCFLSVIIPIYNGFPKIGKCIDSLMSQTEKDFEVILVDDCSDSDSFENVKLLMEKSSLNFTLLRNEKNLGPGPSRNRGILSAKGSYLMFVDCDDYIKNSAIETFLHIYKERKPDCIAFDFIVQKGKRYYIKKTLHGYSEEVSIHDGLLGMNSSTWCKIFSRDIIIDNHIFFPSIFRREDYVFTKLALSYCTSIFYCRQALYYYVQEKNSLVRAQILSMEESENVYTEIQNGIKKEFQDILDYIFIQAICYLKTQDMLQNKCSVKTIKEHLNYVNGRQWELHKYRNHMSSFQYIFLKSVRKKRVYSLKVFYFIKKKILSTIF